MRTKLLSLATGIQLALCCAPNSFAQGTAATETLEEIVVTAEKREVDLQKTSISIQTYSGEQLRSEGKKRIEEIMNGVVGVQVQNAEVGASFFMRGVGTDRGQAGFFGTSPSQNAVSIMVDGSYQGAREAVAAGTLDLAQAEVMRGPQSTTLGGSSLAGAVSLVSKKPVFNYEGYATVEAGNYNKLALEGVLNAPLSDNQALRVAATTEKRDAYLSSGVGNSDQFIARLKYRWQVSDSLDIVLTAGKSRQGGAPVTLGGLAYSGYWIPYGNCGMTATCDAFTRGYPITYAHVENGVTYKDRSNPWDDGMPYDWGHEPMAHYNSQNFSANIDVDTAIGHLSIVPSVQTGSLLTAEAGDSNFYLIEDNDYKTNQLDINLASKGNSRLTWLAGYNYYYTNTTGLNHFVISPGAMGPGGGCAAGVSNCYFWLGVGESSQRTNSLYGNASFGVTDAFRVIGGLRYSKDTKGAQGANQVFGTQQAPGSTFAWGPVLKVDWSKVTYRAGVEYDLAQKSMAYATLSSGYQPGNVQYNPTGTFTTTKEQTLSQITLGIKNRFLDDRLQFNVELFDSTYHDRGHSGSISVGNTGTAACTAASSGMGALLVASDYSCLIASSLNVPNLKSQGADIELNWLPTSADRLDFTLEFLKTRQDAPEETSPITVDTIAASAISVGGVNNPTAAGTLLSGFRARVQDFDGATLQNTPKISANLTYKHDFGLGNGAKLSPSLNVAYKSSYWTAFGLPAPYTPLNPGPAEQDAYAIYNFNLAWVSGDGKFTTNAYVKNIDNTPVLLNYEGTGPRGAPNVSLGDPRTFGVVMTVNF
ncbi:MAG: TonB-dependent receptor [Steroidobacteraceae bacterium]